MELKKTKTTRQKIYDEYGRWKCPQCGAIHHFDSSKGCHRNSCKFEGRLTKVQ